MSDSQRIYTMVSTAEKMQTIAAPGNKCHVKACSAPFGLQFGARNENTVDTGQSFDFGADSFDRIRIRNLSTTKALRVTLFVGTAAVSFNFPATPNTEVLGWERFLKDDEVTYAASLADTESAVFYGIARGTTDYSDAGIPEGSRRKYMTVSLRPALGGKVLVYNNNTDGLLAIVGASSSGGGFPIETDADIRIENQTGGAIQTTGTTPDIAIAETFYL